MLVHIGHNDAVILTRVRIVGIEFIIGDCSPGHTTLACSIYNARVNLATEVTGVVVEPGGDTNTCCPQLDVANMLQSIVGQLDLEANEIIELEILQ